jgi:hypothetical protein
LQTSTSPHETERQHHYTTTWLDAHMSYSKRAEASLDTISSIGSTQSVS